MRRRHQKNPLLMRIIGISVLVHLIALPILAYFGAFKKIQDHFAGPPIVFVAPPPPPEEKKEVKKDTKHEAKKTQQIARRTAPSVQHHTQSAPRAPINAPHVIDGAKGEGEGGEVVQGNGEAGVVPSEKKAPESTKPVEPTKPMEKVVEPVKPVEPAKPVEKIVESTKPVEPAKPMEKVVEPVKPKTPVFAEAEPMQGLQPKPTIPDELRTEALDKTCIVEFVVGPDGRPTSVKITASTNIQELDRLALDAARQWRFKPAMRDGQPIESRVRLHIEFQVS